MQLTETDIASAQILTRQGLDALRAGDKGQAYQALTRALKFNPCDDQAWLWLSGVVATPAERRYCLEQALQFNPDNATAKHGLQLLPDVAPQAPDFEQPPQFTIARDEAAPPASTSEQAQPEEATIAEELPASEPQRPIVRLSIATPPPPFRAVALTPTQANSDGASFAAALAIKKSQVPPWALLVAALLVVAGAVGMLTMGGDVLIASLK